MKRFLLLVLILLGMQVCMAQETDNGVTNDAVNSNATNEVSINDTIVNDDESVFEEDNSAQIQGYVEYNESQEDYEKNAVYLEEPTQTKSLNLTKPKTINAKSVKAELKKPSFDPFDKNLTTASKFSTQEYAINPVSAAYSKKFGQMSFGTMYDSSMDSAQMSYSTGLFAKYEGKRFAFGSGYSKSTDSGYDSYNDKFYIAPEIKLTRRLSFLDVMQTDVSQINKKNELVLRYTPGFGQHRDDIQFELGAGQSFYNDDYVKSSIRFSTKFKM